MSLAQPAPVMPLRRIVRTWWPLATSWMLMSAELPLVSAVVARLANPELQLAAYGGLVFPIALAIEAPIIMLLSASVTLCQDEASYVRVRRYMLWAGALLSLLHAIIVFTPLYYVVAVGLIGAPPEILEPGRLGLAIMLPWTWAIAYRRFNQGTLIRFDQSRVVGLGTLARVITLVAFLTAGYLIGSLPGVAVATTAVIAGITVEAIFIGRQMQAGVRAKLRAAPPVQPALSWWAFGVFYLPLVMTAMLQLGSQPALSAALSRMPLPIESLATWTVVTGLLFILQSMGVALNEVVVALLGEPGAYLGLRRFTALLAGINTAFILAMAATPLAAVWFGRVAGLSAPLAELARGALWLALPIPGLAVLQSWFQGALLHSRRTQAITEAVVLNMLTSVVVLVAGVMTARWPGLHVGVAAVAAGLITQTAWIGWRSRPALKAAARRGVVQAVGAD